MENATPLVSMRARSQYGNVVHGRPKLLLVGSADHSTSERLGSASASTLGHAQSTATFKVAGALELQGAGGWRRALEATILGVCRQVFSGSLRHRGHTEVTCVTASAVARHSEGSNRRDQRLVSTASVSQAASLLTSRSIIYYS